VTTKPMADMVTIVAIMGVSARKKEKKNIERMETVGIAEGVRVGVFEMSKDME